MNTPHLFGYDSSGNIQTRLYHGVEALDFIFILWRQKMYLFKTVDGKKIPYYIDTLAIANMSRGAIMVLRKDEIDNFFRKGWPLVFEAEEDLSIDKRTGRVVAAKWWHKLYDHYFTFSPRTLYIVQHTNRPLVGYSFSSGIGNSAPRILFFSRERNEAEDYAVRSGVNTLDCDFTIIDGTKHDDILYSCDPEAAVGVLGREGNDTLYGQGLTAPSVHDHSCEKQRDQYGQKGWVNDLYGGTGDDRLYAGFGTNALYGEEGNDLLWGNCYRDFMFGGEGDDKIYGHGDDDSLYGGVGNDQLYGGEGDDTLVGGEGDDTYHFNRHDGQDTVISAHTLPNSKDKVVFGAGIGFNQLWFTREGNNLKIEVMATESSLTIKDYYYMPPYNGIVSFEFSNGQKWLASQVEQLVEEMSKFTPPSIDDLVLPQEYHKILPPLIASHA